MPEANAKPPSLGSTRIGRSVFNWGERTYIMGVVNLSPDSFSGDGLNTVDAAVAQAEEMVQEGADLIDVGGESTRPDYIPVTADEEARRVVPVIEKLAARLSVPVSIDTYKLETARRALDAGAVMLNDVWGLRKAPELAALAAERHVPFIATANQRGLQKRDIMTVVYGHLEAALVALLAAGVKREDIIIDPGIGFGKTVAENLELINRLDEVRALLGRPVLLGTSRKSFIGAILNIPPEQRIWGTAATTAIGIARGADIIRVHDVREMKQLAVISDAVVRGNWKG